MRWILKDKEGFQQAMYRDIVHISTVRSKDDEDNMVRAYFHGRNVIAVGDYTANIRDMEDASVPMEKIMFSTSYVDGMTRREEFTYSTDVHEEMTNPAGEISEQAFERIPYHLITPPIGNRRVMVKGEEDLLVLALIILCNNGDYILFGDPFEKCTRFVCVSPVTKKTTLEVMNRYGVWE